MTNSALYGKLMLGLLAAAMLVLWLQPDQPPAEAIPRIGVAPTGMADARGLAPDLKRSIEKAIELAAAEGVELRITSGRRSARRQAALFGEAVAKYGSPEAARQWVLPPDESAHVTGRAVDVGPAEGAAWLAANGEDLGLCQRYANEPWHFERLAGALGSECPPMAPHP